MERDGIEAKARVAAQFVIRYLEDLDEGRTRTIEEYQALHPGFEEVIAREWSRLSSESESSGGATTEAHSGEILRLFAGYRIDREIARGGQAVVFEAWDPRLRRQVALKVLRATALVSQSSIRRLRQEATILAGLDHPAICPLYDAGIAEGRPYMVLRPIPGESLSARLAARRRHGGLPDAVEVRSAARLAEEAARALHAAHERGAVHRDFKPGNVMVTPEGRPVILDFGLALVLDVEGQRLTRTGDVVGTPVYLAPEQIAGDPGLVDRRADVHALGLVLHEMVTLERAFAADSHEAILRAVRERVPTSARRLNRAVPRDLALVIATATEKDPERRYRTALDLAEDLRRVVAGEPIRARRSSPLVTAAAFSRRNPALATLLVLVPLVLVTALAVASAERARTRAARRELDEQTLRATAAGRDATERLAAFRRLDDLVRLDSLVARASILHPAEPALIPELARWLDEARGLLSRLPGHRGMLAEVAARGRPALKDETEPWAPSLRTRLDRTLAAVEADRRGGPDSRRAAKLQEIEGHAARMKAEIDADLAAHPMLDFESDEDHWLHDNLAQLVRRCEELAGPRGLVAAIEARIAQGRALEKLAQAQQDAWAKAAQAIAADARFAGIRLVPQTGLVPLGPDPVSGLHEFAHVASGEAPVRDSRGRLPITESGCIVLVLVPGGTFRMGAELEGTEQHPGDPYATEYEQPVHAVTLDPFFIGKHELTQAQWQRWTGRNPARTGPGDTESGERRLLRPVWRIDFHQAEAVLFEMGLVLPTEAQWEYAARAGTTTAWWTGAELSSCHGACNVGDERLFKSGGLPKAAPHESFDDGWELPAPIGTHRVNPFGLDGMIGNVAEWCRDRYALYTTPALPGDGLRASDAAQERVVRDGSFVLNLASARVSSRYRINANHTTPTVGVRPARKLAGP